MNETRRGLMDDESVGSRFGETERQLSRSGHLLRLLSRTIVNGIIVVGFTGLVALAIWLFYNGYPWLVSTTSILLFMIAPLFCRTSPWKERILLSLTVPFIVLGGILGFYAYFAMFSFIWFQGIFGGKGSGLLGLMIFVFGFALFIPGVILVAAEWLFRNRRRRE
jgi:hypothetical protein